MEAVHFLDRCPLSHKSNGRVNQRIREPEESYGISQHHLGRILQFRVQKIELKNNCSSISVTSKAQIQLNIDRIKCLPPESTQSEQIIVSHTIE